jgi:hypothetical protein
LVWLTIRKEQFAEVDAPWLSWEFHLQDEHHHMLASVSKSFVGFARELFTDSSQYIVQFQSEDPEARQLSINERVLTLATAVSIDFDYFSRHSSGGGVIGWLPFYSVFGGEE